MEICLHTDTHPKQTENAIRAHEAEILNFIMQIKISRNYKINLFLFLRIHIIYICTCTACSVK